MSRKEIAQRLGLTPAAITLITSDMIAEGLLVETRTEYNSVRVGRKEVILDINFGHYAAVGVCINRTKAEIICTDLRQNVIFEEQFSIEGCRQKSKVIMGKTCGLIRTRLEQYEVARTKKILGVGIGVRGIVNSEKGVSTHSFHLWEDNVDVKTFFEEQLGLPVVVNNNVRALAYGELFYFFNDYPDNSIFIKHGPGVGAAHISVGSAASDFTCTPVELGHMIVDPGGRVCSCGNHGCLETIVSYEAIQENAKAVFSSTLTPTLYSLAEGSADRVSRDMILSAYDAGDKIIEEIFSRAAFYFAVAIRNSISLLNPSAIIMYGELFEDKKFWALLQQKLSCFPGCNMVVKSRFNLKMDTLGPASTIIGNFFSGGGNL